MLGYFNSLRELGGARRILEEEVQNTIKAYGARKRVGEEPGLFRDRKTFSEVVELTSRVSTDKVAEARRRLECAVPRDRPACRLRDRDEHDLGRPRHPAARADGRARSAEDARRVHPGHEPRRAATTSGPGSSSRSSTSTSRATAPTTSASATTTRPSTARSRSASVTPFSARALDRGFAGALVGLARHAEPELTPPQGVERIADVRAALERRLLDAFLERVRQQPFADEAEREERLRSVQNRVVDLLDSWRKIFETTAPPVSRCSTRSTS